MLMGPTANVVQPAIQRDELEFKEKGLTCLGLLCTISRVRLSRAKTCLKSEERNHN